MLRSSSVPVDPIFTTQTNSNDMWAMQPRGNNLFLKTTIHYKNKQLKFSSEIYRLSRVSRMNAFSLLQQCQMSRKSHITGNKLWTPVWCLI